MRLRVAAHYDNINAYIILFAFTGTGLLSATAAGCSWLLTVVTVFFNTSIIILYAVRPVYNIILFVIA